MVRVRYTTENGMLTSKSISSINGVLRVVIRRTEGGWTSVIETLNGDSWQEVEGYEASSKNLSVAKIYAKKALKSMGARFHEEVRRREFENEKEVSV